MPTEQETTMTKHEREQALAALAQEFLEPEFYEGPWVEIDSVHGSVHWPDDGYSADEYRSFSDDPIAAVTRHRHGVLCRLSAPGYLDCTEWSAFKTRVEAEEFLIAYGNGD
jgi:hypothetical protein